MQLLVEQKHEQGVRIVIEKIKVWGGYGRRGDCWGLLMVVFAPVPPLLPGTLPDHT
jgi:hypothetical protein